MGQYSKDDANDPVMSGSTILAAVSFVIGGLIDKYAYNQEPPVTLLFAVFCLFLVFDAINVVKNKVRRVEGKLDAILKQLNER